MSILKEMQEYISVIELDTILSEGYDSLDNIKTGRVKKISINEDGGAISIPLIISIVTAAPSLIKTLSSLAKKILTKFNILKGDETIIDSIIALADKWHHMYIKVIQKAMDMIGLFKKAGIEDESQKQRTAEVVFYILIFGLAIFSGVTTVKHISHALKTSHFTNLNMTSLEALLTAIKSKEVGAFIKELA